MFVVTIQIVILTMINVKYRSLGKIHRWIFHVKIVCGKIFSSLGISDENFLTTKYFKVKLFVSLLKSLMHNYAQVYFAQAQTHNNNRV